MDVNNVQTKVNEGVLSNSIDSTLVFELTKERQWKILSEIVKITRENNDGRKYQQTYPYIHGHYAKGTVASQRKKCDTVTGWVEVDKKLQQKLQQATYHRSSLPVSDSSR